MVPPLAAPGPTPQATPSERHHWLTAERQIQLRNILVGLVLFVALTVWVFHSIAAVSARPAAFVHKLRVLGVMTWLYALVQLIDIRYYGSRWAKKRRQTTGLPQPVIAWLFGQMLAWFGILYYGLTEDARWFVAGIAIATLTMWLFPAEG